MDQNNLAQYLISPTFFKIENVTFSEKDLESLTLFLNSNPEITHISFKKASFQGKHMFDALKKLSEMKKLQEFEIDSVDLSEQIEFLLMFFQKVPLIQSLTLRNCNLQDCDCSTIETIIKNNHENLKIIDISDNKIKSLGSNQIFLALQQNTKLLKLILKGNDGIKEEITADINRVLKRNIVVSKEKDIRFSEDLQYEIKNDDPNKENESRIINLKRISKKEIDIENLRRQSKETDLNQLRDSAIESDNRRKQIQLKYNALSEENSLLQAENQALLQEFNLIDKKCTYNHTSLTQKLHLTAVEIEKIEQINNEEYRAFCQERDHDINAITEEYQIKYERLSQFYRSLEEKKRALDERVLDLREEAFLISMQHEENLRTFEEKDLIEASKQFEKLLAEREAQYSTLRTDCKVNELRNKELHSEHSRNLNRMLETLDSKANEINKQKIDINALHHKLSKKTLSIEKKRFKLLREDSVIEGLYRQLFELKREIDKEKDDFKYEKGFNENVYRGEEDLWKGGKEFLQGRVIALEEIIERKREENNKIKKEYESLAIEVNCNLGKVLREVVRNEDPISYQGEFTGPLQIPNELIGGPPIQREYMGLPTNQREFMGPLPNQMEFMGPTIHNQREYAGPIPNQLEYMGPLPNQREFMGQPPIQRDFMGPSIHQLEFMGPPNERPFNQMRYIKFQPSREERNGIRIW